MNIIICRQRKKLKPFEISSKKLNDGFWFGCTSSNRFAHNENIFFFHILCKYWWGLRQVKPRPFLFHRKNVRGFNELKIVHRSIALRLEKGIVRKWIINSKKKNELKLCFFSQHVCLSFIQTHHQLYSEYQTSQWNQQK